METNREAFHAGGPYNPETGEYVGAGNNQPAYSSITTDYLMKKAKQDSDVVTISSGTPMFAFSQAQREELGGQFVDVGIDEEEAATMSAGLAKNGAKPVWFVASTFMQRTYDQWSHDIALNNLPVTVLVYMASVSGMNDESHLGFFDIPFLSHIPNVVYLAPTSKEEHLAMMDWAVNQTDHPVAIRVPVVPLRETGVPDTTDYSVLNKNQVTQKGSQVTIFGLGNFYALAEEVAQKLADEHNIQATIVNPKFITGLDTELLDSLEADHQLVITLEDGILEGGYGQEIASYLGDTNLKVQNYGVKKDYPDRYKAAEYLAENGIEVNNIVEKAVKSLQNNK